MTRSLLIAAGTALLLCANVASAATHNVSVVDYSFNPKRVVAHPGDVIHWTNNTRMTAHTVTSEVGREGRLFDVELQPGQSFDWNVPNLRRPNVKYECRFHDELGMTGAIIVIP